MLFVKERVSTLAEFLQGGVSASFLMAQKSECSEIQPSFSVPIGFKGLTMSHATAVGGKTTWQPHWVKAASRIILPNTVPLYFVIPHLYNRIERSSRRNKTSREEAKSIVIVPKHHVGHSTTRASGWNRGAACGVEVSPENFHKEKKVAHPDTLCFMRSYPPGSAMIHDFANRFGWVLVSICIGLDQSWIDPEKSLANLYAVPTLLKV
jgi:hypothetical protein